MNGSFPSTNYRNYHLRVETDLIASSITNKYELYQVELNSINCEIKGLKKSGMK